MLTTFTVNLMMGFIRVIYNSRCHVVTCQAVMLNKKKKQEREKILLLAFLIKKNVRLTKMQF